MLVVVTLTVCGIRPPKLRLAPGFWRLAAGFWAWIHAVLLIRYSLIFLAIVLR